MSVIKDISTTFPILHKKMYLKHLSVCKNTYKNNFVPWNLSNIVNCRVGSDRAEKSPFFLSKGGYFFVELC